ncbi:MAG TPA: phenylacetate--CoA ligase [Anaerolineae bacterium]|nr:phenylacetate--CoA ligase [Anaerolineae bacterium]
MIWNPEMETMPRAEIEALQSERLRDLAQRLYATVPFYKENFDAAGIDPAGVQGIQDLPRLPFTKKTDLRDNYPFGLFAAPMDEVLRIHASSGTTGKPTVVGYTRADIATWAELCARCFALSGVTPGQMFQNAYGYGLFTGGLGMHYGAELMGLAVIPVSGGNTARQMMILQDFGPDVMACTPSYALTLADRLLAAGIDPADLNVKVFILGAEPWTEEMRRELEAKLDVDAVNIYGLSEIIGPGVSNECVEAKDGAHVFEDHFIVEVIDPETGEPLPDGETGELVFTTLTKEAFPLLRYRTGDLAAITKEACVCGRTHARMSRIVGRADDMLIVRGVNVFPSQIEAALLGLEHITPHYRLVLTREEHLDSMEVQVEVTPEFMRMVGQEMFAGHPEMSVEEIRALEDRVKTALYETLSLNAAVTLLQPGEGPRSQGGKLQRVEDRRELK